MGPFCRSHEAHFAALWCPKVSRLWMEVVPIGFVLFLWALWKIAAQLKSDESTLWWRTIAFCCFLLKWLKTARMTGNGRNSTSHAFESSGQAVFSCLVVVGGNHSQLMH